MSRRGRIGWTPEVDGERDGFTLTREVTPELAALLIANGYVPGADGVLRFQKAKSAILAEETVVSNSVAGCGEETDGES